eukprot:6137779-Prymnesium_polylepis.1
MGRTAHLTSARVVGLVSLSQSTHRTRNRCSVAQSTTPYSLLTTHSSSHTCTWHTHRLYPIGMASPDPSCNDGSR